MDKMKLDNKFFKISGDKQVLTGESRIGVSGIQYLYEAFKDHSLSINCLNLTTCYIGDEGCVSLSKLLALESISIKALNLAKNQIGEKGCEHLVKALEQNSYVTQIYLANNKIGDEGCRYLSQLFLTNNSIHRVYLGRNNIGDKGCEYLKKGLSSNTSICQLQLDDNQIEEKGADHLIELLKKKSIENLTLIGCKISHQKQQLIDGILKNNQLLINHEQRCSTKRGRVIFIGNDRVGKTSLLKRLKNEGFDSNQSSTQVLSIDHFQLDNDNLNNPSQETKHPCQEVLNIDCVDLGGQKIFQPFYSMVFTESSIFVIVIKLDLEKEKDEQKVENELKSWISSLENSSNIKREQIIVVFTHGNNVSSELCLKNDMTVSYFIVDNKDNTGISTLQIELFNILTSRNIVKPFVISEKLQCLITEIEKNKNRFQISSSEFNQISREYGFHENDIPGIISLLKEMNLLFYFPEISNLRMILFVNPADFITLIRSALDQEIKNEKLQNDMVDIKYVFRHFLKQVDEDKQSEDFLRGTIEVLCSLNILCPIRSKLPPYEILYYIIPVNLSREIPQIINRTIEEAKNFSEQQKLLVRWIHTPSILMEGMFGKMMSKLYKILIPESFCLEHFMLNLNDHSKAIVTNNTQENRIEIVVFGEIPLTLLSITFHCIMELCQKLPNVINLEEFQDFILAICPFCYQRSDEISPGGKWSKKYINSNLYNGSKIMLECPSCKTQINLKDLVFDESLLFAIYKFREFIPSNINVDEEAEALGFDERRYPIYNKENDHDLMIIRRAKEKSQLSIDSWIFEKRLGKKTQGDGFYGANSAVYLAKCILEGLQYPDRYYAVKIVYNMFGFDEADILKYQKSEYSAAESLPENRFLSRQCCYFVASINISKLPDWDAHAIQDGSDSLFVVSDVFDGMLEDFWDLKCLDNTLSNCGGYILQLLFSLKFLQEFKMVHRDIKSDNIFFAEDQEAFILADFGMMLSLPNSSTKYRLPPHDLFWGNPLSKPPELIEGEEIDLSKADLSGLGLTLFHIISQKKYPLNQMSEEKQSECIRNWIKNEDLAGFIFWMVRREFDQRVTIDDAIILLSYFLWGMNAPFEDNELMDWKKTEIENIILNKLQKKKMVLHDILHLEYVSSVTRNDIIRGEILFKNIKFGVKSNFNEHFEYKYLQY
eukprot:gb/GECH01010717.1/.p1 GENE.gb/GECH01010717.1/~~gb/GECH01010717.1/.p1  ORF type:complete len:1169 (+),score=249.58 gb/GECH01010717.1/:1-3507(+)